MLRLLFLGITPLALFILIWIAAARSTSQVEYFSKIVGNRIVLVESCQGNLSLVVFGDPDVTRNWFNPNGFTSRKAEGGEVAFSPSVLATRVGKPMWGMPFLRKSDITTFHWTKANVHVLNIWWGAIWLSMLLATMLCWSWLLFLRPRNRPHTT